MSVSLCTGVKETQQPAKLSAKELLILLGNYDSLPLKGVGEAHE